MRLLKLIMVEYVLRVAMVSMIFLFAVWCSGCSSANVRRENYDKHISSMMGKTRFDVVRTLGQPSKVTGIQADGTERAFWLYDGPVTTQTMGMPTFGGGYIMNTEQVKWWCHTTIRFDVLGFADGWNTNGNSCVKD